MPNIRRILFLVLLLMSAVCGVAQKSNLGVQQAVFSHSSVNEELSSNTIRSIIQDNKGFVWFGTARGLDRYDGHTVKVIRHSKALSITCLLETRDTIWIGAENGLYYYLQRNDTILKYQNNNEKGVERDLNVSAMVIDDNGQIWMSTMGSGILRMSADRRHLSRVLSPASSLNFGFVMKASDGTIWASSCWAEHNLLCYNKSEKAFVPFLIDYGEGQVKAPGSIALMQSSDKDLWLGAWDGSIISIDIKTHRVKKVLSPLQSMSQHIHSMKEVSPGLFLIGSDTGLAIYDVKSEKVNHYSRNLLDRNSLSDNFVYPIMKDREGGVWIGTYYGGVNYLHSQSSNFTFFEHAAMPNSVSGNVVNHFCEDRYRRLWIASDDGGLCYYSPGDGKFVTVGVNSSEGEVKNIHALCADADNLYVGTYSKGIAIVNLKTLSIVSIPVLSSDNGGVLDASSNAMIVDADGRLWVGTYSSVAVFNPESRTFTVKRNFGSPVNAIRQDKRGYVWVATEAHGVWCYNPNGGKWRSYSNFGSEALNISNVLSVYSLHEDCNGSMWAATSSGVYRYEASNDTFVANRCIPEDAVVYGVTGDDRCLWMATSEGLLCYDYVEDALVQVYKGGAKMGGTSFLQDAICRTSDNRIYIGTVSGFISFLPRGMFRNEVKPNVVFTGVELFNKSVSVGSEILPESLPYLDEIVLSYRDNMVRISFSAMSFLQPDDNAYSYRLEGFDEDWIESGNMHYATYTNLSPGEYILHVRAKNNDGVLSDEATLRIVVTPPFYWNTPAKILYVLLFIVVIALLVLRIVRKEQKKHKAEIREIHIKKEQEIHEINVQKEQEIQEIHIKKEQEIQEINIQKEQEIQEMNTRMEQEVHDARIKFMTISAKDQAFLDRMEAVIEKNFSNSELTVDFLASELGISRSGLFGKIKNLADVTPNEMILVIRLKHAAEMLQSKQYRVNEVCYMVGFSSPSYFSKCFQKMYGVTPAKYEG